MDDKEIEGLVAEARTLAADLEAQERAATRHIGKLLANSKKIEAQLKDSGQHMEANMLQSLRIGYSTSRAMCKILARDLRIAKGGPK